MKFKLYYSLAFVMMCSSCDRSIDQSSVYNPTSRLYAFQAQIDNSLNTGRASLDSDGIVSWRSNDMLEVYDRPNGDANFRSNYTFKLISSIFDADLAEFEGIAIDVAVADREIFAVYPFCDTDSNGSHDNIYINNSDQLRLTLPEVQDQGYTKYLYMMSPVERLTTSLEQLGSYKFNMTPLVSTIRLSIGGIESSSIESVTMSVVGASSGEGFVTRMLYELSDFTSTVYAMAPSITVSGTNAISTISSSLCAAFSIFPTDLTGQTIQFDIYVTGDESPITTTMSGKNFEANALYTQTYSKDNNILLTTGTALATQLENLGYIDLNSFSKITLSGGEFDEDDLKTIAKMNSLQYLDFSGSTTSIDYTPSYWIRDTENLQTVVLPTSITKFYTDSFEGCYNLSSINLDHITSIAKNAFLDCSKLAEVEISSVESVGNNAFENCTLLTIKDGDLTSLTTELGSSAFLNCESITTIQLPNGVSDLDHIKSNTFEGCSSLSSINIPTTISSIYSSAFKGCSALESIDLPNLKTIPASCFANCGLTSITIKESSDPLTAITIYDSAFANCTNLTTIRFESQLPPTIASNAFEGCNITKIIVPSSSLEAYKIADSFTSYTDIIESAQ